MTTCPTCKHAQWELTAKGNPKRNLAGRCLAPVVVSALPASVHPIQITRSGIWHDWPTNCPTWEAK